MRRSTQLLIDVYDFDLLSKADLIGSAAVEMGDVRRDKWTQLNVPLLDDKKRTSGEVSLRILFSAETSKQEPDGVLEVTVMEARNLPAMDEVRHQGGSFPPFFELPFDTLRMGFVTRTSNS